MSNLEWLDGLGLDRTNLPRLPRQGLEKSGQPKANNDALPRLPLLAPTQNNVKESENDQPAAPGEGGGQENESAAEPDCEAGYAVGFLHCWHMLFHAGMIVRPAQQQGHECSGCRHLEMCAEQHTGTRRKFFWRCDLGHSQLEIGHAAERIIVAPTECRSWEQWQPKS